jgi:hypothetical protein
MPRPTRPCAAGRRPVRRWIIYAAAALCCLGTSLASAAQYDIEVIVFRNLAADDQGEQWPVDTGGYSAGNNGGFAGIPLAQGVEELPASQFALNNVAGALRRSGAYQVLAHRRWREGAYDSRNALPYYLHATQGESGTLDGSIKLIRERYLHLDIDLTLAASGSLYHLDEARRIRSGVLHYFDNPRFGVIALVTPYASSESPAEEPPDDSEPTTVPDEEADTVSEPPPQQP